MLPCLASPSNACPFPGTTKNMHLFFTFLNLMWTVHISSCMIYILLNVFSFMFPFTNLFNCSSSCFWTVFEICIVAWGCPHCQCVFCMEFLMQFFPPAFLSVPLLVTIFCLSIMNLHPQFLCLLLGSLAPSLFLHHAPCGFSNFYTPS